jgi:hypothetical protein
MHGGRTPAIQLGGGGIVQESLVFSGILIGERQRLECKVRVTKTTLDTDPPVFSDYTVMGCDATDRLPDGDYELWANGERTRFRRNSGRFLSQA